MTDNVFVQHGDYRDAANLAQALGAAYRTSYILQGVSLSADLAALELDVADGVTAIWRGDMETADDRIDPSETRSGTAHVVEVDSRSGIELEDEAVNHVFVDANVGTSDSPRIETNTTGDLPTAESFKIGEIDTTESDEAAAVSDQWHLSGDDATLTYPDSDAIESVASELVDGTVVYDRAEESSHVVHGEGTEELLSGLVEADDIADDAVDTAAIRDAAVTDAELDQPALAVERPDRYAAAELEDGESHEVPVQVPDGYQLSVHRWGAFHADGNTAPTGLDVELLDEDDVVQEASNTVNDEDTETPVASLENSTGSEQVFVLRAKNDTGSAIGDGDDDRGVGMHFGYVIEVAA